MFRLSVSDFLKAFGYSKRRFNREIKNKTFPYKIEYVQWKGAVYKKVVCIDEEMFEEVRPKIFKCMENQCFEMNKKCKKVRILKPVDLIVRMLANWVRTIPEEIIHIALQHAAHKRGRTLKPVMEKILLDMEKDEKKYTVTQQVYYETLVDLEEKFGLKMEPFKDRPSHNDRYKMRTIELFFSIILMVGLCYLSDWLDEREKIHQPKPQPQQAEGNV